MKQTAITEKDGSVLVMLPGHVRPAVALSQACVQLRDEQRRIEHALGTILAGNATIWHQDGVYKPRRKRRAQ